MVAMGGIMSPWAESYLKNYCQMPCNLGKVCSKPPEA